MPNCCKLGAKMALDATSGPTERLDEPVIWPY